MANTAQRLSISVHPDLRDDWTALADAVELFIPKDPGCREYTRTRAYTLFPSSFVTPDWPAVQTALVAQFGAEKGDDQVGIETGVYGAAYIAGVLKETLVPDDRLCLQAIKVWLRRFTIALNACTLGVNQPNGIASPASAVRNASAATTAALIAALPAHHAVGELGASLVRTPSNSTSTSSDSTSASQKGSDANSPTPFSTPEPDVDRTTRHARLAGAPSPSPKPEVKLENVALDPILRPVATTRLLRPKTEDLGPAPAPNKVRRRSSRLARSRSPSPDLEDTKPFASPAPARKKRKTAAASPSLSPSPQHEAPQMSAAQYFASVFRCFRGLDGLDLEPDAPLRDPRLAALDCAFKRSVIAGPKVKAMFHGVREDGYKASRNFVAIWPKHNLCAPDTFAYGRSIAILADEAKLDQYSEVVVPPHRSDDDSRPSKPVDAPEGVQVLLGNELRNGTWWHYKGWAQIAYDGRTASTGFELPTGPGAFDSLHPDLQNALAERTKTKELRVSLADWGFECGRGGCITVDSMRRDLEQGKAGSFVVRFLVLRFVDFDQDAYDGWDAARRSLTT